MTQIGIIPMEVWHEDEDFWKGVYPDCLIKSVGGIPPIQIDRCRDLA